MQQIRRFGVYLNSLLVVHEVTMRHPILGYSNSIQLIEAFNLLPDILFWVKDIDCKVVYANQVYVEHVGARKLEEVLGKTDFAFSPEHIAHQFISDDKKVLAGESISNRLELNLPHNGEIGWFSTSKRPLFDERGDIIGTYGVSRHFEKSHRELLHVDSIRVPIIHIQKNLQKDIQITELANITHLSVSALERRFRKHLGKTPKQYINDARLTHARKLLFETDLPIGEVAYQSGFNEPSYFSKQFSKLFGCVPSEFREKSKLAENR